MEKLYVLLLSLHGLVRGKDPELGRDPDTGGQVSYVLDLARSLAGHENVGRVEVVTRLVHGPKLDPIYAEPYEKLAPRARIVRLECGPRRYLRKEVLWPHLEALTDRLLHHIRQMGRLPDVIHGHYADAGQVGSRLAELLGVPFVFTGHSLGRVKRRRLLDKGIAPETIEKRYNLAQRIEAEEFALDNAAFVVTSTNQEVAKQYALYHNYQPSRMTVIPPGIDLERFAKPARKQAGADSRSATGALRRELARFWADPDKPIIFSISRADERKNIPGLLRAYADSAELRELANLLIVAGNRTRLRDLEPGARRVILTLLRMVDEQDLHGSVAYPKTHAPEDVPVFYRLAAESRGVFVNPALTEPFGLTLLEAAASGLPVVSTDDGGPRDIIQNCRNGVLVDPLDTRGMAQAILKILKDGKRWKQRSQRGLKGVHEHYSWSKHVDTYLQRLRQSLTSQDKDRAILPERSVLPTVDRLLITDIDNTLIGGDKKSLRTFLAKLEQQKGQAGFGVATGRRIDSAVRILDKHGIKKPDLLITAVGSEIHYGERLVEDLGWRKHLDFNWEPEKVRKVLKKLPGLRPQAKTEQRRYKISYNVDPKKAPSKRDIISHLRSEGLRVRVIHSHNAYLDILPIRASKGLAIRHIAFRWGLTMDRILVAGDSGNDIDMLGGDTLGVVVGNHDPEMDTLRGKSRIIFTKGEYARGILEGIEHYNFFDKIRIPGEET